MPKTHLDPWPAAPAELLLTGSPRQFLVAAAGHAILAPSNHNAQPWLLRLRGDALDLLADRTRALPVSDPEDRELAIGCGAALAFLQLALLYYGIRAAVERFPDPREPDLLARVRLGERCTPSERDRACFQAIATRRTTRVPFEHRRVPETILARARAAAQREGTWLQTVTPLAERAGLAELVADGDRVQMANRSFRRELAAWVHSNRQESRDGMPGYAHGLGNLASEIGPLVIRTFDLGNGKAARDHDLAIGSPALAVLWTENDGPPDWVVAGEALGAALLSLEAEGVKVSYLNQPLELPELRGKVSEVLAQDGVPQILLRLGYGPEVRPTPRRPVGDVLIEEE